MARQQSVSFSDIHQLFNYRSAEKEDTSLKFDKLNPYKAESFSDREKLEKFSEVALRGDLCESVDHYKSFFNLCHSASLVHWSRTLKQLRDQPNLSHEDIINRRISGQPLLENNLSTLLQESEGDIFNYLSQRSLVNGVKSIEDFKQEAEQLKKEIELSGIFIEKSDTMGDTQNINDKGLTPQVENTESDSPGNGHRETGGGSSLGSQNVQLEAGEKNEHDTNNSHSSTDDQESCADSDQEMNPTNILKNPSHKSPNSPKSFSDDLINTGEGLSQTSPDKDDSSESIADAMLIDSSFNPLSIFSTKSKGVDELINSQRERKEALFAKNSLNLEPVTIEPPPSMFSILPSSSTSTGAIPKKNPAHRRTAKDDRSSSSEDEVEKNRIKEREMRRKSQLEEDKALARELEDLEMDLNGENISQKVKHSRYSKGKDQGKAKNKNNEKVESWTPTQYYTELSEEILRGNLSNKDVPSMISSCKVDSSSLMAVMLTQNRTISDLINSVVGISTSLSETNRDLGIIYHQVNFIQESVNSLETLVRNQPTSDSHLINEVRGVSGQIGELIRTLQSRAKPINHKTRFEEPQLEKTNNDHINMDSSSSQMTKEKFDTLTKLEKLEAIQSGAYTIDDTAQQFQSKKEKNLIPSKIQNKNESTIDKSSKLSKAHSLLSSREAPKVVSFEKSKGDLTKEEKYKGLTQLQKSFVSKIDDFSSDGWTTTLKYFRCQEKRKIKWTEAKKVWRNIVKSVAGNWPEVRGLNQISGYEDLIATLENFVELEEEFKDKA